VRDRDRALGAYIGAAIGDAMGGPVECTHAARIKRLVGEITGLLPYQPPYTLIDIQPGYALQAAAGSVTDDTFIRGDLTRFFLATQPPRTPELLAEWMLAHADFRMWWPPAVQALRRVQQGEVSAREAGKTWRQGGGVGWWTPVGILHAGHPQAAAQVARELCAIWKAPLEQDLVGAVQAGVAEAQRLDATAESVVEAMLGACGPLAHQLLQRAIAIARQANDVYTLVDGLYQTVLVPSGPDCPPPPLEADANLPPHCPPLADSEQHYSSIYLSEQIPLAVAAFVFGRGQPRAIPVACMLGRDADTTATTVGSWVGGLHGESGLPREWVDTVCRVNLAHINIRELAERLYALAE